MLIKEINANQGQIILAGVSVFVLGIAIPTIGSLYFSQYLAFWYEINESFHILIEAFGASIAVVLSVLLYYLVFSKEERYYSISASALLVIGLFDIAHVASPPGNLFVWFHTLSTFFGGIIFSLVWLNLSSKSMYLWTFGFIALVVILSVLREDLIPLMLVDGSFTVTAIMMNIIGGIGFYIGALFFLFRYLNNLKSGLLLFAILCTIFGSASLLFETSLLWNATWWWWHWLRFFSYIFALAFSFYMLKQQHNAIVSDKHKIDLLLDSIGEGIYGLDMNGNCTWANNECARLIGVDSPDELIGKNMHECHHHTRKDGSHYPIEECNIFKAFTQGIKSHHDDEVLWHADGHSYPAEYRSMPVFEGEKCIGSVVSFTDISKRKELEEQLRQSQKMESIGTLVGGIAHDFNNILASILGYTELSIKVADNENSTLAQYLKQVHQSSCRASELVKKMLTFSRGTGDKSGAYELAPLIREAVNKITPLMPSKIKIALNLDESEHHVFTSLSDIHQLLNNLCNNARDSMEGEGTINIDLKNKINVKKQCQSCHMLFSGNYLQMNVKDNGSGIKPKVLKHIFEPYYTTKNMGSDKGSGLGLAVVHGIIHKQGGHLMVDSKPGNGSSFKLFFPIINL